jgi:hypothetical protein
MSRQQMEQITAPPELGDNEKLVVDAEDVVEPNDVLVPAQLSQHIDLFLQLGNVLRIAPEQDAFAGKLFPLPGSSARVTLRLTARSDADLPVRPFPNDQVPMK